MSAHPIFEHLFANLGLMAQKPRDDRDEAIHGICVADEDKELQDSGLWCDEIPVANYFADIPTPNPINQEDAE